MTRPRRFLPPVAGGAQKTGWEALEKWVGGGSSGAGKEAAPAPEAAETSGPSGKTGWEALEKWVGDGGGTATPSAEASSGNGAAEQPVAASAPSAAPAPEPSGGFMGFLKRIFGGK